MAVYNRHDWINEQRDAYELWYKLLLAALAGIGSENGNLSDLQ